MYNIDGTYSIKGIRGLKPRDEPSAMPYWIIIICCFVGGIALIFIVEGGILPGIIFIIAGFILRWWHKTSHEGYKEYKFEQARIGVAIGDIVRNSENCFSNIYKNLREARKVLDEAETHFNERAYSPFWDSVEKVALELGHFSENLVLLSSHLEVYLEWVPLYHETPSKFPVTSEEFSKLYKLGVKNALAKRMEEIVGNAQRDYQFASIFEQRKTHKLLVAGFNSFADVLNEVGNQITDQVEYLNTTVQANTEKMTSLMEAAAVQRDQHHEEVMETLNKDGEK
ncbi:MAG: hypothetical protein OXM61_10800 [Candidatus Poribacteria bacterium]|nr:hypothetical protein [Candidatus Poribacteria bacterium]